MASKLSKIPDSALWLGLGIFLFIAAKQVSHGLQNIRSLTQVPKPTTTTTHTSSSSLSRNQNRQSTTTTSTHILPRNPTHQEDAISTTSLITLATSSNTDISHSATKIICQRFYASASARRRLIRDLQHGDTAVQHRAKLACRLLCEFGVMGLPQPSVMPSGGTAAMEGWRVQEPVEGAGSGGDDVSERDLRRRRREAVVIHDGERPVGEEDLFMRG